MRSKQRRQSVEVETAYRGVRLVNAVSPMPLVMAERKRGKGKLWGRMNRRDERQHDWLSVYIAANMADAAREYLAESEAELCTQAM